MELTYTRVGDYYIPDLVLTPEPEPEKFYGKYGDLRREYIREYRPALWASLVNSGRVDDHLTTIERLVEIRMDKMLPQISIIIQNHSSPFTHNFIANNSMDLHNFRSGAR